LAGSGTSTIHAQGSKIWSRIRSVRQEGLFCACGQDCRINHIGCSIGFNLHCDNRVQAPGVFPRYTTSMFHAQIYDCDDVTTAYFIFVVRNPLDRWISAFNYYNPSTDWEGFRIRFGEKHFNLRSKLYAECPFNTVNDIGKALSAESNVTDVCKSRAEASIDGTEHFGCHHYFNYQFHLEAVPENATIMALRTEHLIEDWNSWNTILEE